MNRVLKGKRDKISANANDTKDEIVLMEIRKMGSFDFADNIINSGEFDRIILKMVFEKIKALDVSFFKNGNLDQKVSNLLVDRMILQEYKKRDSSVYYQDGFNKNKCVKTDVEVLRKNEFLADVKVFLLALTIVLSVRFVWLQHFPNGFVYYLISSELEEKLEKDVPLEVEDLDSMKERLNTYRKTNRSRKLEK